MQISCTLKLVYIRLCENPDILQRFNCYDMNVVICEAYQGFFVKDWVGQRKTVIGSQLWWNWEVDSARYSGWKQLINDLSSQNIKVMTYCNPCLAPVSKNPCSSNVQHYNLD